MIEHLQWVVRSIPPGGLIELFLIPTSASSVLMVSCEWEQLLAQNNFRLGKYLLASSDANIVNSFYRKGSVNISHKNYYVHLEMFNVCF